VLKWCSYCQQFKGESPEYDDFSITHGLCKSCASSHVDLFSARTVDQANFLRRIFNKLFEAGRRNDFDSAARIVEEAIAANCRPVDILIGMIAPMLFQIGEDWKRGTITVEDEHRFTAFCERVVDLVEGRITAASTAAMVKARRPMLFLMNAPGNRHTLAIRILSLWLMSQGMNTRIIDGQAGPDALLKELSETRPGFLLVSMALLEQHSQVAAVAEQVQRLPETVRPKMLVGGYPVKLGLVPPIPGADLVADISALSFG